MFEVMIKPKSTCKIDVPEQDTVIRALLLVPYRFNRRGL
jgi:hypothetical protein